MKVTLLDTVTGKTAESSGIRTSVWEHGNWSCDCNRRLSFESYNSRPFNFECLGCSRYIVVSAEVEMEDDYETSLGYLNFDYPDDLLIKNGVDPLEDEAYSE